jgi:glyoxylase-like metal-dependent hydrolase (beta-lactamase superfamily II)
MTDTLRLQRWQVGDAQVTRIEEQLGPGSFPPAKYFDGFEPEVLQRHLDWLVPHHYLPAQDALVTSVHSWLVQTPRLTVLVDGCSGNHKDRHWWPRFHMLDTPFLQRLAAAGVAPGQVDVVMCTHLHADHIGWNTQLRDGRWVPTFPNARYLFSRAECEHWDPRRHPGSTDPHRLIAWRDSVLPVLEAGLAELVDTPHEIDAGLLIEAAPGHTPGHVMLRLRHPGGGGIFCGDVIHHPLQVCAPHWNSQFCAAPQQARDTRRRVLEHCAESGALLLPTHFGAPHVAAVQDRGHAFHPVFVPPLPLR